MGLFFIEGQTFIVELLVIDLLYFIYLSLSFFYRLSYGNFLISYNFGCILLFFPSKTSDIFFPSDGLAFSDTT